MPIGTYFALALVVLEGLQMDETRSYIVALKDRMGSLATLFILIAIEKSEPLVRWRVIENSLEKVDHSRCDICFTSAD